jgi:hypothetical protein
MFHRIDRKARAEYLAKRIAEVKAECVALDKFEDARRSRISRLNTPTTPRLALIRRGSFADSGLEFSEGVAR